MRKISFEQFQSELINWFKLFNNSFETNDIHWWMNSGTLLGAVREGGQISWDDDVDMTMFNIDFIKNRNKISEIAIQNNWELIDPTKTKGLDVARLFSNEKIVVEYKGKEFVTKFFIDIMIAIPSKRTNKIKSFWWEVINKYSWIYGDFYNILPKFGWRNGQVKKIGFITNFLVFFSKLITFPFMFWVPIKQKLKLKKIKLNANKYQTFYSYNNKQIFYSYDKNKFKKIDFEDFKVNAPINYEEELLIWFGKDWKEKPIKEKQIPHNLILTPNNGENYKISPFLIK